jgi:hypothetical protein
LKSLTSIAADAVKPFEFLVFQSIPRDLTCPHPAETPQGFECDSPVDLAQPALAHPMRHSPTAHVETLGQLPWRNAIDRRVSQFPKPELDVRIQPIVWNLFRVFPTKLFYGFLGDPPGGAA